MDARVRVITKTIKELDRNLYAQRDGDKINIYRENTRLGLYEYNGLAFAYSYPNPQYIMSLTDNWNIRGTPVEWGLEPICRRLREIDGWNRKDLEAALIKNHEQAQEGRDRDRRNATEAKLYEVRDHFKKATSDINTALINKRS